MTVEAALAVCGLVAVLVLGVEAVMTVVGQVRCTDAAREAARVVARGEGGRAEAVVRAIAPEGARLVVRREGDTASVEVSASRVLVDVRARAYAVMEPGVAEAGGAGPEVAEAGGAELGVAEPGGSQPGVVEPEVAGPGVAGPGGAEVARVVEVRGAWSGVIAGE